MDNQLSNYSVTSIKICHVVCALNIYFFKTCTFFSFVYKDLIFYILNVCLPVYIYIYNKTKQAYSIRIFLWGAKLGILYKML